MNPTRTSTIISIGLLSFAIILIAAQFMFQQISTGGGWCKPSLDAPAEQGFYAYQFTRYGFPVSFITVVKEECFSEPSITYEWFPPGIVIDGLLPGIVLYVWFQQKQRYKNVNETSGQEK